MIWVPSLPSHLRSPLRSLLRSHLRSHLPSPLPPASACATDPARLSISSDLLFGLSSAVNKESDPKVKTLLTYACWATVISWCTYPIVYVIPMFGVGGSEAVIGIQVGVHTYECTCIYACTHMHAYVHMHDAWHTCMHGTRFPSPWQLGYCVSDIISKCGVGFLIYNITIAKSANEPLLK